MDTYVGLQYNGEPNKPQWRGKIPPITPQGGLGIGESVAITPHLMTMLRRDPSYQSRYDFATFLAEVYNRKGVVKRWTVLSDPVALPEPVSPEPLQSDEKDSSSASGDDATGGKFVLKFNNKAKEETD